MTPLLARERLLVPCAVCTILYCGASWVSYNSTHCWFRFVLGFAHLLCICTLSNSEGKLSNIVFVLSRANVTFEFTPLLETGRPLDMAWLEPGYVCYTLGYMLYGMGLQFLGQTVPGLLSSSCEELPVIMN